MITTVIRLPEEEYKYYKDLAHEKGISLAEFFRVAARKEAAPKKKHSKYSIWDLGTKVVSHRGPKDGSVNADKYYYEFEEAKIRKQHKKK